MFVLFTKIFLKVDFCRETVLFPGCPRSSNERRHCGVILPEAFFFSHSVRQDVPFTHVNAESVNHRVCVKRIIFMLTEVKYGYILSSTFLSYSSSLAAPCVINSKVRLRFYKYSLLSDSLDLFPLCGHVLCKLTSAFVYKVYRLKLDITPKTKNVDCVLGYLVISHCTA